MNKQLAPILAECLDALERGEATLDECLARYPEQHVELAALLETAAVMRDTPRPAPTPAFRTAARRRLLARISTPEPVTVWDRIRSIWQTATAHSRGRSAMIVRRALALGLVALILSGAGLAVYASAYALPGDAAYPLKIAVEDVRLALASGVPGSAGLHLELAARRLGEAQALAARERPADLPAALARYQAHMQAALDLLASLPDGPERAALAGALDQDLASYQLVLNALVSQVPRPAQPVVQQALQATTRARATAQDLLTDVYVPTASPTHEASATHEASDTPRHTPTHEPGPSETPHATEPPHPTATEPRPTGTEPHPTATEPHPSETPHPTEPPRPTETPHPTEPPHPTDTPHPTEPPHPTATEPHPTETPHPTEPPHPTATEPHPTATEPRPTGTPHPTEPPHPSPTATIREPSPTPHPTEPHASPTATEPHATATYPTPTATYRTPTATEPHPTPTYPTPTPTHGP